MLQPECWGPIIDRIRTLWWMRTKPRAHKPVWFLSHVEGCVHCVIDYSNCKMGYSSLLTVWQTATWWMAMTSTKAILWGIQIGGIQILEPILLMWIGRMLMMDEIHLSWYCAFSSWSQQFSKVGIKNQMIPNKILFLEMMFPLTPSLCIWWQSCENNRKWWKMYPVFLSNGVLNHASVTTGSFAWLCSWKNELSIGISWSYLILFLSIWALTLRDPFDDSNKIVFSVVFSHWSS